MAQIILAEGAAPPTPSASTVTLYAKTDSEIYLKDDTGLERALGGVPDGDKGDITVSGAGLVWTVNDGTITGTKLSSQINLPGAINEAKGTSVAAAATTNIWATDGNLIHVTGTGGPITSLGTAPQAGATRTIVIDSAGVVITNGANLVCPEGVNIVTSAGDILEIVADTTTQHRVASYVRSGSRHYIGSFTRDISLASGTQVVTGVGFRPNKIFFQMALTSTFYSATSSGVDDGISKHCVYDSDASASGVNIITGDGSIVFQGTSGNNYTGLISSMSDDGFTITWTKGGTPAGTITIRFIAEM